MKKVFIILAILTVSMTMVFATVPAVPEGADAGVKSGTDSASAYAVATFDLSATNENAPGQKVVVGFIGDSGNAPSDAAEAVSSTESGVTLSTDTATAKATNKNDYLALFYQIQSNKALNVTLSLKDDLKKQQETDPENWNNQTLAWKVEVKSAATSGSTEKTIASASYGSNNTSEVVYVHDGTTYGTFGTKELAIETAGYTGIETGVYVGHIVISVGTPE